MEAPTLAPGLPPASAIAVQAAREIRSQAGLIAGSLERVDASWVQLEAALRADPSSEDAVLDELVPLLAERLGGPVDRVFVHLVEWLESSFRPQRVADALLRVREAKRRPEAISAVARAVEVGKLVCDAALAAALARSLGELPDPLPDGIIRTARGLLAGFAQASGVNGEHAALVSLLSPSRSGELRRAAARVLDANGVPPEPRERAFVLGEAPEKRLARYLEFSRAGFVDLVELTGSGSVGPALLDDLEAVETELGADRLARTIAALGWSRISLGLWALPKVAVEVERGMPLIASSPAARLLAEVLGGRAIWRRDLVVAVGGSAELPSGSDAQAEWVGCFRRLNLRHADLLALLLEVAPLTPDRARKIVAMAQDMVEDFLRLFGDVDREADAVRRAWDRLRQPIAAALADARVGCPLDAETTRRVRGFEDPATAATVTTLHGLKRFVHQRGLSDAFRRFGSLGSTSRTVDMVVLDGDRIGAPVRAIRFVDLDAGTSGGGSRLPPAVRIAVNAFSSSLLCGCEHLPDLEMICFGAEVHAYLRYRNHPAFLRLDLSPPLRGGLIDLEYFAVSQYDLDHHPGLELPAIRHVLQQLEFDVQVDGVRLHARYDKERAFDLEEVLEHVELLLRLAPWLMDLDWTIGGLEYSADAKKQLIRCWAQRFAAWGVLPVDVLLTPDRRHVISRIERDAAGDRALIWQGSGTYRDILSDGPPADLLERLRSGLAERGLAAVAQWHRQAGSSFGQLAVDRAFLAPFERALERGEVVDDGVTIRPASRDRFERIHEAVDLARVLSAGGRRRHRAGELAAVVAPLERHLSFVTTGEVNGHPVQRAEVSLAGERIDLAVLRDGASEVVRLAVAYPQGGSFRRFRGGAWEEAPDLGPEQVHTRLLAAGYPCGELVGAKVDVPAANGSLEASGRPVFRPAPGERVVRGLCASPGRAAGIARLGGEGLQPADLEGAVLVAAAVGPEAAPQLRKCRAVVSTGGGVLSHAGLIALELGKPALVVAGRWQHQGSHGPEVVCRRLEYRETTEDVAGLAVTCRRDLAEREEVIREGDLLVVDASAGVLLVLGKDRDALAIDVELRALEQVSSQLSLPQDPDSYLTLRGRLLRTLHQLDKLVRRVDDPVLRRYLVWELLAGGGACSENREPRRGLLAVLLDPASPDPVVQQACTRCLERLGRDLDALEAALAGAIEGCAGALELTYLEVQRARAQERLDDAEALAGAAPGSVGRAAVAVPDRFRVRLEELAEELVGELEQPQSLEEPWRLRHVAVSAQRLEALGTRRSARLALTRAQAESTVEGIDREAVARVEGRMVVGPLDGGLELRGVVGGKAANLGEIRRALGRDAVPTWFTVTDHAFRTALAAPVDVGPGEERVALAAAIARTLQRPDLDHAAAAGAVRRLWQTVVLPETVAADVIDGYLGLAGEDGEPPLVAVRSSSFEEDADASAWAGQFDTFLFVRGEAEVLAHLRLAWAGLWGERALHRREACGSPAVPGVGGGVIVQRMVAARVAGVVHTSAASVGDPCSLLVNVGLGLGEGIVSGQVDADLITVPKLGGDQEGLGRLRYVVGDKRERFVFDTRRGRGTRREPTLYHQRFRPALEYVELAALVALARRLENVYRQPLDIEFAFEGTDPVILQARPIPVFHHAWRTAADRAAGRQVGRRDGVEVA